MEMIISWFTSGVNLIVPFVILISLTVFVHELGHFLVAKYFGVRVEVFSIGIGKKIWTRRRGETEYAISLFPIGGYVKMYGDELGAEVAEEEKQYSFVSKPVLQRIAVVLAGPFMNLLFAILLFVGIAMVGEEQKSPIVGDILEATEAYTAGIRSGDTVLSIDEKVVRSWLDIQNTFNQKIGSSIKLKLRHLNGTEVDVQVTPKDVPDLSPLALKPTVTSIPGLSNSAAAPGIGISDVKSWAYKAGFRTGDFISKIQDQEIKYGYEIEPVLLKEKGPLLITVARGAAGEKMEDVVLKIESIPPFKSIKELGIERGEFFVAKVMPGAPAEKAGLHAGDRLVEIAQQPVSSWELIQSTIKTYKPEGGPLKFKVLREGENLELTMVPEMTATTGAQGLKENRFTVGMVPWLYPANPATIKVQYGISFEALGRGFVRTWEVTAMTAMSILKLFKAEISPRNISGIISIGQVASETFKMGLAQFFSMMGVISINLFILNLLPVPVLDGGHMVFYTIELLKGSPLSLKKIEWAQKFGVLVLMSLMVFALFNDFARIFGK